MNPSLASVLCYAGIVYLLVRDVKQNPRLSHALWIPLLWFLISASRMPTEWISGGAILMSSGAGYESGSPLDRNIFLILMIAGAVVLSKRTVSWGSFTSENVAITIFFAFTFLSILWSDFPLVAFKRWHKVFGHIILVLVVLTEEDPHAAFAAVVRRCAYVLLPYSVLYLKYYPDLGRSFDNWTGAAVNTGITTGKNALANLAQITGLYFLAMMFVKANGKRFVAGLDFWIYIAFLYMAGWLLYMAQSSTATVATALGAGALFAFRWKWLRRPFTVLMVTSCLVVGYAYLYTDIKDTFLEEMGEDTTLTGRTDLWADLAVVDINPLIGVGFESFWLGDRLAALWEKYWWQPNQAHNGYFEMYLNLGWIGLGIMLAMIVAGYRHARIVTLGLDRPSDMASALARGISEYRVAFLLSLIAFNFTEATFKAVHPSFFLFFLSAVQYTPDLMPAAVPSAHAQVAGDARQPLTLRPQPEAVAASSGRASVLVIPSRTSARNDRNDEAGKSSARFF